MSRQFQSVSKLAEGSYFSKVTVSACSSHSFWQRLYQVGGHLRVKLSGGRIVEATIKAVVETTVGVRLQLSSREETALI